MNIESRCNRTKTCHIRRIRTNIRYEEHQQLNFEELVREHQGGLRAFIRALGTNETWVDDLAQEVFIIAYRKREQFRQMRILVNGYAALPDGRSWANALNPLDGIGSCTMASPILC